MDIDDRCSSFSQILPCGFWVKPLPFSDDFRDLSSVIPLESRDGQDDDSAEETKDITDRIVKKLTFKVSSS